jgi:hypothetical protein
MAEFPMNKKDPSPNSNRCKCTSVFLALEGRGLHL